MVSEINATLKQQGGLGQTREYQILNGKELRVCIGNKSRKKEYIVSMLALGDKARLRFHVSWGGLVMFIVSLLLIIGFYQAKKHFTINLDDYEYLLVGSFSVLAIIGLLIFIMHFKRKRVFFTRHSKIL